MSNLNQTIKKNKAMKNFKITATAPTTYQLQSLRLFGLNVKSYANGSHVGEEVFTTEQEAKDFLIKRAEMYFESENELNEAISDIENYGSLRMDAVCASIEEVEEEEI
jgi:hypothetical protein